MCIVLSLLIGAIVGVFAAKNDVDALVTLVIFAAGVVVGWLPYLLPL